MNTMIDLEPQRASTVVRLPGSGDARRTEYVGTARFTAARGIRAMLRRSPNAPRGSGCRTSRPTSSSPTACRYSRACMGEDVDHLRAALRRRRDERDRRSCCGVHR